jgi:hypothetical protein
MILSTVSTCRFVELTVSAAQGNGIWAGDKSDVTIDRCEFTDGKLLAIGIAEKSCPSITSVTILRYERSGVVIRNGSRARIAQCRIEGSGNFGVFASFADSVTVENTVVRDRDLSLILALDQAAVDVRKYQLLGTAQTAVHCYTGAVFHFADTLVAVTGQMAIVKMGGSVHLEGVALGTGTINIETG